MRSSARHPVYGLMAEFEDLDELIAATRKTRQAGFRQFETYAPLPSHELIEAMEFGRNKLPLIIFIGGLIGCIGGFFMQYYISVIDYPLNVGGRPLNSWPSFIPVTFETTVLLAAVAAVLGMLALNGLPMPYHPVFNVPDFELASRDRFFLMILSRDENFDTEKTKTFLGDLKPLGVFEVEH